MLICNHHIDPAAIVGIGPLMYDKQNGNKQLFFMLHLAAYSIKIESIWIEHPDLVNSQKLLEEYKKFSADYKACVGQIARRIATRTRKAERPVNPKKSPTKTK